MSNHFLLFAVVVAVVCGCLQVRVVRRFGLLVDLLHVVVARSQHLIVSLTALHLASFALRLDDFPNVFLGVGVELRQRDREVRGRGGDHLLQF